MKRVAPDLCVSAGYWNSHWLRRRLLELAAPILARSSAGNWKYAFAQEGKRRCRTRKAAGKRCAKSVEPAGPRIDWLRGLDLNQRPLGYERPEISVSIGQQGTSGNPEIPLGTAGTAHWGPYGDAFGHCPTMCPTISPNGVVLVSVEFTFDQ